MPGGWAAIALSSENLQKISEHGMRPMSCHNLLWLPQRLWLIAAPGFDLDQRRGAAVTSPGVGECHDHGAEDGQQYVSDCIGHGDP